MYSLTHLQIDVILITIVLLHKYADISRGQNHELVTTIIDARNNILFKYFRQISY